MKAENLKCTLVNKIKIAFNNIWKATKQLQIHDKPHDPDILMFTSLIPNGII
jgi:hypothetical protein